jgi:hypothetical protein
MYIDLETSFASARVLVRAEGLEPSRGYPQRIFVPATAFAPPEGVCGLDYPFTVAARLAFRVRCCPQNHPRHLNQAIGITALSTINASPKGYPATQSSSGIYLKFIP